MSYQKHFKVEYSGTEKDGRYVTGSETVIKYNAQEAADQVRTWYTDETFGILDNLRIERIWIFHDDFRNDWEITDFWD